MVFFQRRRRSSEREASDDTTVAEDDSRKNNLKPPSIDKVDPPLRSSVSTVTCGICMDDFSADESLVSSTTCLCSGEKVGVACSTCLQTHFTMIVDNGFSGACPPMKCPFHPKRIVPFMQWKPMVEQATFNTVKARAKATLSIQCSSCHNRRDMWLSDNLRPEPPLITLEGISEFDDTRLASKFRTRAVLEQYQNMRADFLAGSLPPAMFIAFLNERLVAALTNGDQNGNPCPTMVDVLNSLGGDPEREAALHSAYLRKYPDCHTACCRRRHCYRCHIKDFHTGMTCEEYQASKTSIDDVVPCPQCGLQLTKGDGCPSVNCLCGKNFNWDVELKKVHEALALAFARELKDLNPDISEVTEESIADMAVLINYHGKLPARSSSSSLSSTNHGSGSGGASEEEETDVEVEKLSTDKADISNGREKSFSFRSLLPQGWPGSERRNETFSNRKVTTEARSLVAKADIGVYVRASAWATLNARALQPARSRLFEKQMSSTYTTKVLPFAAHHILSTRKTNDKDRVLTEAWEIKNRPLVLEATRDCERAKASLWESMHYAGMLNEKQRRLFTLTATLVEQMKYDCGNLNLDPIVFSAMQSWLRIETNRHALSALQAEKAKNRQPSGLLGWDLVNGSRAVSIAVDMLDRRSENKAKAGDTYEALLSDWLAIHQTDIDKERSLRFENYVSFSQTQAAGASGGDENISIVATNKPEKVSFLEKAVDVCVGCGVEYLNLSQVANASAWVQIHEDEANNEMIKRWTQAVCAAIEKDPVEPNSEKLPSNKEECDQRSLPVNAPRHLETFLEENNSAAHQLSSIARHELATRMHNSLLSSISQGVKLRKTDGHGGSNEHSTARESEKVCCAAHLDPIEATADVDLKLRPSPWPESNSSGGRFSKQALRAYGQTFRKHFVKEINQVYVNRWTESAMTHYQLKLGKRDSEESNDLGDEKSAAPSSSSSSSSLLPAYSYANGYSSDISPLTVLSCMKEEEDRRALEYAVDVQVKEVSSLSSLNERYRSKWIGLKCTPPDALEREKVRRWMAFCSQTEIKKSNETDISDAAAGGGGGGDASGGGVTAESAEAKNEKLIKAAVEVAADVQVDKKLVLRLNGLKARVALSAPQRTYLTAFLKVAGVSKMIEHCLVNRFEACAFCMSEEGEHNDLDLLRGQEGRERRGEDVYDDDRYEMDHAAQLALDMETGVISKESCSTIKGSLNQYLNAWLAQPESQERLEKAKMTRLFGLAGMTDRIAKKSSNQANTAAAEDNATKLDSLPDFLQQFFNESNYFLSKIAKSEMEMKAAVPYSSFLEVKNLSVLHIEKKVSFAPSVGDPDFDESMKTTTESTARSTTVVPALFRSSRRRRSRLPTPQTQAPATHTLSEDWNCTRCTFINTSTRHHNACSMCGLPREAAASTITPQEPWNCLVCTFHNENNTNRCEICTTTRPVQSSSNSGAPPPPPPPPSLPPSSNPYRSYLRTNTPNHTNSTIMQNYGPPSVANSSNSHRSSTNGREQASSSSMRSWDVTTLPEIYRTMIEKLGLPEDAVRHRMVKDGFVHPILNPPLPSNVHSKSGSSASQSPLEEFDGNDLELDLDAFPSSYKRMIHVGVCCEAVIFKMKSDGVEIPYKSSILHEGMTSGDQIRVLDFISPLLLLVIDAEDNFLRVNNDKNQSIYEPFHFGRRPYKSEVEACYNHFKSKFPLGEKFLFKAIKFLKSKRVDQRVREFERQVLEDNFEVGEGGQKCLQAIELLNANIITRLEACAMVAKSRLKHFGQKDMAKYGQAKAWSEANKQLMDRAVMIEMWINRELSNKCNQTRTECGGGGGGNTVIPADILASLKLPENLTEWYEKAMNIHTCLCGEEFASASKYYSHRGRCGEMGIPTKAPRSHRRAKELP